MLSLTNLSGFGAGQSGEKDPYWSSVSSLLHFDTAPASTIVDSSLSTRTVSKVGSATTSSTKSKFGGYSLALNGSTDYASVSGGSAISFGTGDFTIETFLNLTSRPSDVFLIGSSTNGALFFAIYNTGALGIGRVGVAWDSLTTAQSWSLDTWYHLAVSRVSGVVYLFVNGNLLASPANTTSYALNNPYFVGAEGVTYFTNGYMDELRITTGVGRYTSSFTAPTAAFPNQ